VSYVVRSDITYGTGERSVSYWTGGCIWALHPSDAVKFETKREAMGALSEYRATPAQRGSHPHTYSAVEFDEFEGLRDG
jgi:hypothetical protein